MHTDTREDATSMGRVLNLKREHDANVEEARKRQLLEVEMAHRTPEPAAVVVTFSTKTVDMWTLVT
jgi:hypothetical protein